MGRRLVLILGNGFTMDFLHHVGKADIIDVRNLFKFGSHVKWPVDKKPGFLSFKYCPNLWNLGARPHMNEIESLNLIEDIITCVNVFVSSPKFTAPTTGKISKPNDIYIFAYKELAVYLKHLFIYYDNILPTLDTTIENWSWTKFLKHVYNSADYSEVTIITYNYDVWIEKILKYLSIPYNISLIGTQIATKINILKPHGSISFAHKKKLDISAFQMSYNYELLNGDVADFNVLYTDLAENYPLNALIPPAGDSGRFSQTWAYKIRERAKDIVSSLTPDDEMVICGISYWHVDRAELDEIMVSCSDSINLKMINPNPSRSFNTVVTSIFNNYIYYNSSKVLEDLI